jgi:acyl transferase domain-containing protein
MAKDLLGDDAVFRHWMRQGDALVAQRHGFSVLEEIYGEDRRIGTAFDHLEASHPALFLVQYALAKALQHRRLRPDLLLGVSLGEFTAQAVAGMTSFEATLYAISDQPALFRQSCPRGGMISVLAPSDLHARSRLLSERSELAGINSEGHFVLAALDQDMSAIEDELKIHNAPFQRLAVPYAFHSRFIDEAEQPFKQAFSGTRGETPFWPIWSACTGTASGPETPDLSWRVVRERMNVRAVFAALEAQGGATYVDLSPSGTLAAIFRQIKNPSTPSRMVPLLSPFGGNVERIDKALASLQAVTR